MKPVFAAWAAFALLASATCAGPAFAQVSAAQSLAFLDIDKDGKVNLNEYLNFQLTRMKQSDSNANGFLSREEFKASLAAAAQANAERSFQTFDANKDRRLNQDEFLGYHAFVFKNYLDTDRDGFVSLEEWQKLIGG